MSRPGLQENSRFQGAIQSNPRLKRAHPRLKTGPSKVKLAKNYSFSFSGRAHLTRGSFPDYLHPRARGLAAPLSLCRLYQQLCPRSLSATPRFGAGTRQVEVRTLAISHRKANMAAGHMPAGVPAVRQAAALSSCNPVAFARDTTPCISCIGTWGAATAVCRDKNIPATTIRARLR